MKPEFGKYTTHPVSKEGNHSDRDIVRSLDHGEPGSLFLAATKPGAAHVRQHLRRCGLAQSGRPIQLGAPYAVLYQRRHRHADRPHRRYARSLNTSRARKRTAREARAHPERHGPVIAEFSLGHARPVWRTAGASGLIPVSPPHMFCASSGQKPSRAETCE